ncbi:DNA-binding response regulator [Tessaracoccus aquimaris]|uniref:DNA-binding response regulator n=1 Tax=Tessaracoccus aquimaris TaxID=1332264 RepID=A0A1Q2CS31_9ACTN|nr:response regulator transcription factor [Tessaracoccus aquimaris]AQP48912.1 DNA-binding response regulator [Tessaracoccus aquimaris]
MPIPTPVRVLIVDDESLVRSAFRALLSADPGYQVVAEAKEGGEGVTMFGRFLPDIVLMDLQMAPMNGVQATREICEKQPDACVLALTTFGTRNYIVAALRAGAAGYLLKDSRPEQLLAGIQQALRGDMPLSSTVRRQLVDTIVADQLPAQPEISLTPREKELLEWLTHGLTNRQIARNMHLSEGSVKQYLAHVGEKLGVTSRTQILVKAIQLRLVDPHRPSGQPAR